MDDAYYAIETIVTLCSLRDAVATKGKDGRRVRHYVLSKETEQAVNIKRQYVNGAITGAEVVRWCYRWIDAHECTDEEIEYLGRNRYLGWLKEKCTIRG